MSDLHDPLLAVPVSYLITGLLAAGARFILTKEPPTMRRVIESLLLALAVIFSIYPYLKEETYSHGIINIIIGFLSFTAKNILEVLDIIWEQIKKDPLSLLREFLNKIKPGGK